jgi:nifR3 family TIM-barrel protein
MQHTSISRLRHHALLAPLAGVTDSAFRQQCARHGAALTCTELTSVEGIVRKEQQLSELLDVQKGEKTAIQLVGNNPKTMAAAARIVAPMACVIDLNVGCPANHITKQEAGAALLLKPERLHAIVTAIRDEVKLPVTAKIRAGPTERKLVYKEVALTLQEAGVSMITFHPRTVAQGYSGKTDWTRIKELVETLEVPVCGNGDVTTPEEAARMLAETGCHAVMVGRAAMGNPFFFKQYEHFRKHGSYEKPTLEERGKAWEEYLAAAIGYGVPFARLKMQAMLYAKGYPEARRLRERIGKATDVAALNHALKAHL